MNALDGDGWLAGREAGERFDPPSALLNCDKICRDTISVHTRLTKFRPVWARWIVLLGAFGGVPPKIHFPVDGRGL